MKQFNYKTEDPKGNLFLIVPSAIPEDEIKYECDCAYSAWKDTGKDDDGYLDMPEYGVKCLNDVGIVVAVFGFEEEGV